MSHDPARGRRVRDAILQRHIHKTLALAAELDVSAAAVSRWQNGGHLSLESACALAELLDVSLDWLLLGRGTIDWHRDNSVSPAEIGWIVGLRARPARIRRLLVELLEAIPPAGPLR
ncbi:helix-turn-helix domain protein [Rhizobium sp. PDO1-076]|uniref:helix-turn-helix domain-containing protein n=1 Tax=Rhizobium sp. PDO1-076 TaxID=1125979 RepID=UPI00024E3718|nr:helix-turn-helix transcriptional regulator [Rhizobium sp. PDO1-076]EHS53405.1 helix-turn-helix domain protein [Rhizobium sp. PDO1-076]